jgi:hypothetical protein
VYGAQITHFTVWPGSRNSLFCLVFLGIPVSMRSIDILSAPARMAFPVRVFTPIQPREKALIDA